MKHQELSTRYARALFELATESKNEKKYYEELISVRDLFSEDQDLGRFIKSPLIRSSDKEETLKKALDEKGVSDEVVTFLRLLAKKERLTLLTEIIQAFQALTDTQQGIKRGVIKSAKPVSAEAQEKIRDVMSQASGKKLVLEFEEDKNLIGGVSAQVGSLNFDDSLMAHLNKITEKLNRSLQ